MTAIASDLLAEYRPTPGTWDDMVDDNGRVRETWSQVATMLGALGLDELARRRTEARRLLHNDGVSYNSYGTSSGQGRRWRLDPVPIVISSAEWATIERGIVQRAELLSFVLADIYGPRDLLRRGLLPPALVYAHPGFLRAVDGVRQPGRQQLFTCAIDLARSGDDTWVLSDRTQAPSGAGYALENRVITSRVLPSLYREAEVHRLAPFFRTLRASLEAVAPPTAGDPSIVVLTPGSLSETAFEHALLASYLGYPLVEGSDLVMRDGRVWLRSLGRHEPVDVILRRVDSWYCDPLELQVDSHLGVAGMVEANRLGTVSIVNTLGSGVLENPALQAYLPAISRDILGQPLRIPCVPTWWCGDDAGLRRVLGDIGRLVVKPVFRGTGLAAVDGRDLTTDQVDNLRRRIEARPHEWVGQEPIEFGTAPTLTAGGLAPRRNVLRTFVVARGESYEAMPGGLTRVAPSAQRSVISNQAGASSKDTWVLATEPEIASGYWLRDGPAVAPVEPAGPMPSRAAENLFWLGRYAERAEGIVRLLRVVHGRRNEFAHGNNAAGTACVEILQHALATVTGTGSPRLDEGDEMRSLAFDEQREGSLAYAIRRMLDAAFAVRDQLSVDTWLVVGELERDLLDDRATTASSRATFGRVLRSLLALSGLASESMIRDPGWRFMEFGRRIERAVQLVTLLRATVVDERDSATDSLVFESVLTAAESIITYRRRYRSHAQAETVFDLLLVDSHNPRSLAYQLHRLTEEADVLPGERTAGRLSDVARLVLDASTMLQLTDTSLVALAGTDGRRADLDGTLAHITSALGGASDAVNATHFVHLLPQRALQHESRG